MRVTVLESSKYWHLIEVSSQLYLAEHKAWSHSPKGQLGLQLAGFLPEAEVELLVTEEGSCLEIQSFSRVWLCPAGEYEPKAGEPHNSSKTEIINIREKPKKRSRTEPQLGIQVFLWTQNQATQERRQVGDGTELSQKPAWKPSDQGFSVANNRNVHWGMQAKQNCVKGNWGWEIVQNWQERRS